MTAPDELDPTSDLRVEVRESVDSIDAAAWDRLAGDDPFLSHAFLGGLERHGCVGPHIGWLSRPLVALDADGRLVGAVPLYLKYHSHGEFVFDWAWADAYERNGIPYYPKLVAGVPFTPATGRRLLTAPDVDRDAVAARLAQAALDEAHRQQVSSLHWLFPEASDRRRLEDLDLLLRAGCHFHWTNRAYADFDDFLARLTAKRRKEIRRERRRVAEADIEIDELAGDAASEEQWAAFAELYRWTFRRKGNLPTLNRDFFREVGHALGDRVLLVLARREGREVAGALYFRSERVLFGRYWGAREEVEGLHFEACYYRGIDYCIRRGLERFEPGVQGEHKLARGFLPTRTWSAHWIAHPAFREGIADFIGRERRYVERYRRDLLEHTPFKKDDPRAIE